MAANRGIHNTHTERNSARFEQRYGNLTPSSLLIIANALTARCGAIPVARRQTLPTKLTPAISPACARNDAKIRAPRTRARNEQGSREVPSKRRSILLSLTRSIHHATAASDARRQTRSSELSPSLPPACARNEHIIRHSAHAPERQRPHGTPSTPPGGGLSLAPVSFVIEQGPCHLIPSLFRTCARCTRARGTGASLMLLCSFDTFVSALIIFIINSIAMESSH